MQHMHTHLSKYTTCFTIQAPCSVTVHMWSQLQISCWVSQIADFCEPPVNIDSVKCWSVYLCASIHRIDLDAGNWQSQSETRLHNTWRCCSTVSTASRWTTHRSSRPAEPHHHIRLLPWVDESHAAISAKHNVITWIFCQQCCMCILICIKDAFLTCTPWRLCGCTVAHATLQRLTASAH